MKKFLLFAAGVAMAATATAQDQVWAVVGAYTDPNWNFEASSVLTGTGDELSVTIEKFTSDFKIVEISQDNWNVQYGTSTPVEIGVPVQLEGKNGDQDPANIKFAFPIQVVNFATVKFNKATFTLTVDAEESDVEYGYPTLYMTGSFNEWLEPSKAVPCTFDEKTLIYTCKVDLGEPEGDGGVEFKLAGAGWSNEVCGPEEGIEINDGEATPVSFGGSNLVTFLTGEQTLTFNIGTMLMTFGDPSLVGIAGDNEDNAVETIEVSNAAVEYYNLQGVRVANPENGIFIRKQGNKATKVVL